MDETEKTQPAFVVVRGRPDPVELAAVTAVLLARLRAAAAADAAGDPGETAAGTARAPWGAARRTRPRVGWTAAD
ncbi:acyl-CoA carboxylase epsilon subunit [Streptomyces roseicoloratus]|uniref:Acyl-CoA carboxylase epsilon subunit n=1 Tax=Streptomyces roseicoloratus TaxID=2508722 RepID=A0ABY9RQX2_9ACTN|nr:acyl-CoA carboxylase epsilon subunit [Streptomyces roseicoloratus]WMX44590.1 acyl-CoA carboxylase epsilon subunit [Streptomyces roseicoloratus]